MWARALAAPLVGAVVLLGGGAWSANAGAANPPASAVILSTSLPGFVAAPAGDYNGPISSATLMTNSTDNPDVLAEIENGSITGYLRCWDSDYPSGMGIVCDTVVTFPDASQTQSVLGTVQATLPAQYNLDTFPVSTPSGALGYSTHNALIPGSTDLAVSFSRGNYASFILSATPADGVSVAQIEQLAQEQWAALPGAAGPPVTPATPSSHAPTTLPSNESVALSSAVLSSSGVGGIEALAVLFGGAVAIFFLVLCAIDFIGRRRHQVHPVFGDPGPDPGLSVPTPLDQV